MFSQDQEKAIEFYKKGYNFFLTGAGGTGKSYIIKHIANMAKVMEGKNVSITALTGCAALLLGNASTLHSWAGIGLGNKGVDDLVKMINKNRKAKYRWTSTDVLIIDEVSMLGAALFDTLNEIAKQIRKNRKPFGGIQLILTGDFCQLPPINDEFCFKSEAWNECIKNIVYMKYIHRQKCEDFQRVLNKIRMGEWDEEVIQTINNRRGKSDEDTTRLYPLIAKVDTLNEKKLNSLKDLEYTYTPEIYIKKKGVDTTKMLLETEEYKKAIEKMHKNYPYKERLTLKKGSKVMLVTNLCVEDGLVNGSQGIVTDLYPNYAEVLFLNGVRKQIAFAEWESSDIPGLMVCMLPLILCWAISIHKIQGSTLDEIDVDIGTSIFEYGQVYVALSRVKTIDGLFIDSFDPSKIKVHPEVKEFYEKLNY